MENGYRDDNVSHGCLTLYHNLLNFDKEVNSFRGYLLIFQFRRDNRPYIDIDRSRTVNQLLDFNK